MTVKPDVETDLSLLLTAASAGADEAVRRKLEEAGFGDVRRSHGYVFQHLLDGPLTIGRLAELLGMTGQGASKAVKELESLGYVLRTPDPEDARARLVGLTERGHHVVSEARAARGAFRDEVRTVLGEADTDQLLRSLQTLAVHTGGLDLLLRRKLKPAGGR
ncbi:MarR family transcriptional regulator [Streptomyces caniferus]|uniref:MarR family transcriptional regulator n=1 Tax=Streptomyces caniferus TaxID=285557 RepID=A0ABZ1VX09_9ACTN|nr:MarR family transcriptional regulator [Streptomyces caniferus]